MKTTTDETKTLLSPCAECGRETTHVVLGVSQRGADEENGWWWSEMSQFLRCGGCQSTSLRKLSSNTATDGDCEEELLPPPMKRRKPQWISDLEPRFEALFREIYAALDAGTAALPVMGARTVLDLVIRDQVGDKGSFHGGLVALETKGLISKHDLKALTAAVEAGNAAAHRAFAPKAADIDSVMEIVEHLVSSLYVLKHAARSLKKVTPRRRRHGKKKSTAGAVPKAAAVP